MSESLERVDEQPAAQPTAAMQRERCSALLQGPACLEQILESVLIFLNSSKDCENMITDSIDLF